MKMALKRVIRAMLRSVGQTTSPISQTYDANRSTAFRRHGIDLVIDVGANVGQYAATLRGSGYEGQILSLEPLPDAYDRLARSRQGDAKWKGVQAAAGPEAGTATINVSADTVCSSLLPASEQLETIMPSARMVSTLNVDVMRLDDLDLSGFTNVALKLDVQGFEKQALVGAGGLLAKASLLEIELAIEPVYEGAYTLTDALPQLMALGFDVVTIGRGYSDPATGRLIDADILFERRRQD